MKIAIFTEYYYPYISGVVTHIEALKKCLEDKGNEVMIVTADPSAKDYYIKDGVLYCPSFAVKKIYGYGITLPISFKRLKFLEEFDPDIVHIHTEFTIGLFGLWFAKKFNKPIVYSLHTMYDEYTFYVVPEKLDFVAKPIIYKYIALIAKQADEITSPSPKGEAFLEKGGIHKSVTVIPNPTDSKLFSIDSNAEEKRHTIRNRYNFKDDETVLCFCGRLGKEKSIDMLIDYFSKCCKENPVFKLLIMGDGPEMEYLKECALNSGYKDRIVFSGKVKHEEISSYYFACDLYATASVTETNSISALEGMACGLLVLQRLDPTNKYQIQNGKNGYLFDDEKSFIAVLNEFHNLPLEEKNRLRNQVRDIASKYGPEQFINKILNVYNNAYSKKHI